MEERCQICGKTVHFKVIDGKINNREYIAYHARQALFPQHRLYLHEYPKK